MVDQTLTAMTASVRPSVGQRGFSLIEVLITVIVLSVGLLGYASLQGINIKASRDGMYRSLATMYTYDMIDRITANSVKVTSYTHDFTDSVPTGTTVSQDDIRDWVGRLNDELPGGQGRITNTPSDDDDVVTVEVRWINNIDDCDNTDYNSVMGTAYLR